ncbi:hypothetical protein [Streptomyces sp. NPDC056154]|uniref:hypothetical protein n=1 Tax=Streptomyces sp. NPDC056154 TaxID=3345729 RepID=UPI0035DE199C
MRSEIFVSRTESQAVLRDVFVLSQAHRPGSSPRRRCTVTGRRALALAVAGGWAALESLLVHPDDPRGDGEGSGKAIAADRMAAIMLPGSINGAVGQLTDTLATALRERRQTTRVAGQLVQVLRSTPVGGGAACVRPRIRALRRFSSTAAAPA